MTEADRLSRRVAGMCEEYNVREMYRGDGGEQITQVTTYNDDTRNWITRVHEAPSLTEALRKAAAGAFDHEEIRCHEPEPQPARLSGGAN